MVASGSVVKGPWNQILLTPSPGFSFGKAREYLHEQINKSLSHAPLAGLIPALTIGMREGIAQKDWQVFRDTGTSHLMAISGLHIGLMAGFLYALINFCWRYL